MDLDSAKRRLEGLFDQNPSIPMPDAGAPLAVYGAGNCGRDVLRVLRDAGYRVAAFLDIRAARIRSVGGIPCHAPHSPEAVALADQGTAVVIAVFNFSADTGEIETSLRRAGFENLLTYYALEAKFPGRLESRFWIAPRDFWEAHRPDLLRGLELWEDAKSREIYLDLVELRLTSNLQLLRAPDRERQYFPCDLPPLREPVRLIDGGAFVGDTIAAMRRFKLDAVAAFEPDPGNYRALQRWVDDCGVELENVVLFPCGLGSEKAVCRFQQGWDAASTIAETGETTIQVVALDDVLPRFAPTLIKLDIEGAEIAALNGAAGMIRKHQPRIAACVYHLPAHLWEVPLRMKELAPHHRLYLRYHGFNGFDAVAYAVEP